MFDYYTDAESFKSANGYTIEDQWFPRVTRIIGIKAKPALYRFYGEMASFGEGQSVSRESAKEGTLVHETSQAILLGQKPEIEDAIRPTIEAFQQFLDQKSIQTAPEYIERRIVHYDHRYAGTIDALALIDGKFGVLDIKTSQGIYRDYNLQTAAYIEALKNDFQNLQTRWILRLDQTQACLRCGATLRTKGGREKIKNTKNSISPCPEGQHAWSEMRGIVELREFPYWQSDFEAFLAAKRLWEWENEYWLKKVGYI